MALYLPKYNSVFIHIYKTAGTTLRIVLNKIDKNYSEIGGGHSDYSEIQKDIQDKVVFSVVRNPYTWIYSLYQYGKSYISHPFYVYCATHNFDEFVVWHFNNIEILNQSGINGKLQTQTEYLSINGSLMVSHILKMENLEVELNQLFRNTFRHNSLIRLPNENSTPYQPLDYTSIKKETIELINQKYEADFQNFNYKFI